MKNYKKPEPGISGSLYRRLVFYLPIVFALAVPLPAMQSSGAEETPPQGIKLLIADFADSTVHPDMKSLIKPVLHFALQQSDRLSVYPEIKARQFIRENFSESEEEINLPRARQICSSENIPVILLPGINTLDGSLIISARLIHVQESREMFVDTIRVEDLKHLAITIENLSKRIRQSLGEDPDSPSMAGNIFATVTDFQSLELFSQSLSYDSNKNLQASMECLENLLQRNSDMGVAQLNLGLHYLRLQKYRDARLYISKAKENSENLPLKYRYLIDGLDDYLMHRYTAAGDRFRSFAAAFPQDWQAFFLLGRCEAILGNYPEAAKDHQSAIALDDTRIESRIGLALALLYNRDSVQARRTLENASKLVPDHPDIAITMGLLELVENNPGDAIPDFKQAMQRPLYRSRSMMLLAQADIYSGKFDNALTLLETGVGEDVQNRDALAEVSKRLVRAQIFRLTGDLPAAVAECLSMPDTGDDPALMAEKGAVLAGAGRTDAAEKILLRLRSIQDSPFVRALADRLSGEIQSAKDQLPQARQSLLRAREFNGAPSAPLALVLMKTQQLELAAAEFAAIREHKAAMLFPDHLPWFAGTWVQALYDAGLCSLQVGNSGEAKQYFRQYLWVMDHADPDFETPSQAETFLTGKSYR